MARLIKRLDVLTLLILACLFAISTYAVYEATSGTRLNGLHINNLTLQGAFCVPMLLIALVDYRLFVGKAAYFLYAARIGMLVLVQAIGENLNGAVRWLRVGSVQIQPSELAKIVTILLICNLLRRREGEKLRLIRDIVPIVAVAALPTYLIMKQPDLGTALVFIGILLGMLWIGNIRTSFLVVFAGAIIAIIWMTLWLFHSDYSLLSKFVEPHQLTRIQTFLDPTSDPDKSWHVRNAIGAVGSGQFYGDDGFYYKQGYIPYAYSDSIYVIIGERFGFIGSAVLLLLYFLLIYRMIIIVGESRDLTGSYLVVGLISMIVFQIFVNIGMHIGLLPLTGISLPFISYGGSSLLVNMIAVGLVLNVKIHQDDSAWRGAGAR